MATPFFKIRQVSQNLEDEKYGFTILQNPTGFKKTWRTRRMAAPFFELNQEEIRRISPEQKTNHRS